jgi:hypothetical protein
MHYLHESVRVWFYCSSECAESFSSHLYHGVAVLIEEDNTIYWSRELDGLFFMEVLAEAEVYDYSFL